MQETTYGCKVKYQGLWMKVIPEDLNKKWSPIRDFLRNFKSTTIIAHKNSVQYGKTEQNRLTSWTVAS